MRDPNVEKLATELVQHTSIVGTCSNTYMIYPQPIKIRQKGKQRSSLLVGGTEQIQLHAALAIWCQNDLQKRVNRRLNTWRNGCFGKMDDHPVHTTPNHHPPKWMFLKKNVSSNHPCRYIASAPFKYILYSSVQCTSPNQH